MPRLRLTKSAIDALPTPDKEIVYWDETLPGFGLKLTPAGKKVFIALYRTAGRGSRLRKYTIGPYGRLTLHSARAEAQKIFAARLERRDPASEKREGKRRIMADRVEVLIETFHAQHLANTRSGESMRRVLEREVVSAWRGKSLHEVTKRDVVDLVSQVQGRGAPHAANTLLKVLKTFFRWCMDRAILERSPAEGIRPPTKEIARERSLSDEELVAVILAARRIGGAYGGIVELLALTAQRREEVAQMTWDEIDLSAQLWTLPSSRTKNGRPHCVHLSEAAAAVIERAPRLGSFVFTSTGKAPFQDFTRAKARLDEMSGVSGWRLHDLRRTVVSGMARLGVAPHVADRILNHVSGTISGVAAVYQRYDFLAERKSALELWGDHVARLVAGAERLGLARAAA